MANNIFNQIKVTPDDLLLDPNNPRLVDDFEKVEDKDVMKLQSELESKFSESKAGKDEFTEKFTDISDLYNSMLRVGYVGIDRIVVREIEGKNKYLVLEGNRRTSAIKRLVTNAKTFKGADLNKYDKIKHTFDEIDVLQLKTKGLTEEQVEQRISIMLGLRHFGSVLDWEPINRACNIYQNYMSLEPGLSEFKFQNSRCAEVANQLAVSVSEVKAALKTYITYLQLTEINTSVEEEHYSLIAAAIPLASKSMMYFDQDDDSFKFSEDSLSRLQGLCQFEVRKGLRGQPKKIIVPEPKSFNRLGKLIRQRQGHKDEVIRNRAATLINQVEAAEVDDDGNLTTSIEDANSQLTKEMNRKNWVVEVGKLLDKREKDLPFEKYDGEGNHLKSKEQLEDSISIMRRVFGV